MSTPLPADLAAPDTTIPADIAGFPDLLLVAPGVPWVGLVEDDQGVRYVAVADAIDVIGEWFVSRLDTGEDGTLPIARLRLPLTRPECRAHLARLCAVGLRCPACEGRGVQERPGDGTLRHPATGSHGVVIGDCEACAGTGWLRRPAPAFHLLPEREGGRLGAAYERHAPFLLAAHARSVAAGGPGVVGVLGEWQHHPHDSLWTWVRRRAGSRVACDFACTIGDAGWSVGAKRGPETGAEGRAAADAAAIAHHFALVEPDGSVRVPHV